MFLRLNFWFTRVIDISPRKKYRFSYQRYEKRKKNGIGNTNFPSSSARLLFLLLYRGKEILNKNGILCWPVDQFLLSLDPMKSHTLRERI